MTLVIHLLLWLANTLTGDAETDDSLLLANKPYMQSLSFNPDSSHAPLHRSTPTILPNILQLLRTPTKNMNTAYVDSESFNSVPSSLNTEMLVSAELPKNMELIDLNRNEKTFQKLSIPIVLIKIPLEDTVRTVDHPPQSRENFNTFDSNLVTNTPIVDPYCETFICNAKLWSKNAQIANVDLSDTRQAVLAPSAKDEQSQINTLNKASTHLDIENSLAKSNYVDKQDWMADDVDVASDSEKNDQVLRHSTQVNLNTDRFGFRTVDHNVNTFDDYKDQVSPYIEVNFS